MSDVRTWDELSSEPWTDDLAQFIDAQTEALVNLWGADPDDPQAWNDAETLVRAELHVAAMAAWRSDNFKPGGVKA